MKLQDLEFRLVGAQVTDNALDDFEKEIGGVLDRSYREFLLAKNGGVPSPELVSSLPLLQYRIGVFYELSDGYTSLRRGYFDLAEVLKVRNSIVQNLLPIASDFGDRNICILAGTDESSIFVVPIASCGDDDGPLTVVKVAESFSTFVDSLSQPEEIVNDVEQLAQKSWREVREYLRAGGDMNAKGPSGLSLLCQSIRYSNDDVFRGLLVSGADLAGALEIAVMNYRLDLLKELVAKGCNPAEGLPSAVGPKRKEIREFLKHEIEMKGR